MSQKPKEREEVFPKRRSLKLHAMLLQSSSKPGIKRSLSLVEGHQSLCQGLSQQKVGREAQKDWVGHTPIPSALVQHEQGLRGEKPTHFQVATMEVKL